MRGIVTTGIVALGLKASQETILIDPDGIIYKPPSLVLLQPTKETRLQEREYIYRERTYQERPRPSVLVLHGPCSCKT